MASTTTQPQAFSLNDGPGPQGRQRRVLIIDDSIDDAMIMQMLLEIPGHIVRASSGGLEGIEMANTFHPEVILLDIGLRGIDGYEVARRLRADPRHATVMLIALTGYGQEKDVRMSRQAGCDYHFIKPPDVQKLLAVISGEVTGITAT